MGVPHCPPQTAVRDREFARCDVDGNGVLSPYEFGMHLLSYAPKGKTDEFVARAEGLRGAAGGITKQDFFGFTQLLLHLPELQVCVFVCLAV